MRLVSAEAIRSDVPGSLIAIGQHHQIKDSAEEWRLRDAIALPFQGTLLQVLAVWRAAHRALQ
jgi:hypothetical protein